MVHIIHLPKESRCCFGTSCHKTYALFFISNFHLSVVVLKPFSKLEAPVVRNGYSFGVYGAQKLLFLKSDWGWCLNRSPNKLVVQTKVLLIEKVSTHETCLMFHICLFRITESCISFFISFLIEVPSQKLPRTRSNLVWFGRIWLDLVGFWSFVNLVGFGRIC